MKIKDFTDLNEYYLSIKDVLVLNHTTAGILEYWNLHFAKLVAKNKALNECTSPVSAIDFLDDLARTYARCELVAPLVSSILEGEWSLSEYQNLKRSWSKLIYHRAGASTKGGNAKYENLIKVQAMKGALAILP